MSAVLRTATGTQSLTMPSVKVSVGKRIRYLGYTQERL